MQVVWAETTHVGAATSSDGVYIVANYSPAGNWDGEYADNVKPEVAQSLSAESATVSWLCEDYDKEDEEEAFIDDLVQYADEDGNM